MLKITIPQQEFWDDKNQMFISISEKTISLEHSLISISKWESKWHRSFLSNKDKTEEETKDYIKCMCMTSNVDDIYYNSLTAENFKDIKEYIDNPNTAVWFPPEADDQPSNETVTAELIYYWMIANQIPFDPCEKWHLNKLLALIRVCSIKNTPPKKMSASQIAKRNRALNEARCRRLGTKG